MKASPGVKFLLFFSNNLESALSVERYLSQEHALPPGKPAAAGLALQASHHIFPFVLLRRQTGSYERDERLN